MGLDFSYFKFGGDDSEKSLEKQTYDPQYGFQKQREARVMIATEEEMVAAKIPRRKRDYCAHLLIQYDSCVRSNWPFRFLCNSEKHKYLHCQHEDFILRMKELERERRLKLREARLAAGA